MSIHGVQRNNNFQVRDVLLAVPPPLKGGTLNVQALKKYQAVEHRLRGDQRLIAVVSKD